MSQQKAQDFQEIRMQLYNLLQDYQEAKLLTAFDVQLLVLRLGLDDGRYFTLSETSEALHMSNENIRRRQYIILRKKIRDSLFFHLLKRYNQYVRLPRGIQNHIPDR